MALQTMALPPRPQKLGAPRPAPAAKPKGKPPIALIVMGILAVAVGCVFFVMYQGAAKRAAVTGCANNLSQLWKMQCLHMMQMNGNRKLLHDKTGEEFWLVLEQSNPPHVTPENRDIFLCPLRSDHGKCDYRGPAESLKGFADDAWVGADKAGNHPEGGNALRKSGDVHELHDEEFRKISGLRP